MQRGNIIRGLAGPRSWQKCPICGKVVKGERGRAKHRLRMHKDSFSRGVIPDGK